MEFKLCLELTDAMLSPQLDLTDARAMTAVLVLLILHTINELSGRQLNGLMTDARVNDCRISPSNRLSECHIPEAKNSN